MNIKLYHHKTDGGAEYLSDKFIECEGGHKEGIFKDADFIVRIDGDITKDAEMSFRDELFMDEKTKSSLIKILDYMGGDEEKSWEENGKPKKNHIYLEIIKVANWLKKNEKTS